MLAGNPAYLTSEGDHQEGLGARARSTAHRCTVEKTGLRLDFDTIGSIDQLKVERAQLEMAPDEWLVIYALADDQNRSVLYAFGQYLTQTKGGKWLSIPSLKRLLRSSAYPSRPGSGFRRSASSFHTVCWSNDHERPPAFSGQTVKGRGGVPWRWIRPRRAHNV